MLTYRLGSCLSIAVLIFAGACGSPHAAEGDRERQATPITEAIHAGGTRLQFKVGCANELVSETEVKLVEERDDAVVLSATRVPAPDGIYPGCVQGYYVDLQAPLGDRLLLDQDGDVIEIRQVVELEASDQFREVG